MGVALSAETRSITTGQPQMLYSDEKDIDPIAEKQVVLLDDVISTGSILQGMQRMMENAGAQGVTESEIFIGGNAQRWKHIIARGHLQIFIDLASRLQQ